MPDMEQLFNQWARQALEPVDEEEDQMDEQRFNHWARQALEPEDEEAEEEQERLFNHWAQGPLDVGEDSEDDNSDSEFGWGDCDGNHPDGEHCEICASSFDCYCCDCYANGAYAGDESFHYYYRLFYWYYYCFYMEHYAGHYAERATRGSQSRHDRDEYL